MKWMGTWVKNTFLSALFKTNFVFKKNSNNTLPFPPTHNSENGDRYISSTVLFIFILNVENPE